MDHTQELESDPSKDLVQSIAASPSGPDSRRPFKIRTKKNTPYEAFEALILKLPDGGNGSKLTPPAWPWQTYATMLSDQEVMEVKSFSIVQEVEEDTLESTVIELKRELQQDLRTSLGC